MKVFGDNQVLDLLLSGEDEVVFNVVLAIREHKDSIFNTDGRSYLTAQMNASLSMWIYAC